MFFCLILGFHEMLITTGWKHEPVVMSMVITTHFHRRGPELAAIGVLEPTVDESVVVIVIDFVLIPRWRDTKSNYSGYQARSTTL